MNASVEQTKRAIRRDGYNRGIRAALRVLNDFAVLDAEVTIRGLLKPRIDNPNFSITER
jgi:hypothetical protein